MATSRCWHGALVISIDTQLRDVMQELAEVNVVATCPICGKPCRVWLYYDSAAPLLMVKEETPWDEIDYYSWTGTEWWED